MPPWVTRGGVDLSSKARAGQKGVLYFVVMWSAEGVLGAANRDILKDGEAS